MTQRTIAFVTLFAGAVACGRGGSPPAAPSAASIAAGMDTRIALPLLPMMAQHQKQQMRDHLAAMQGIVGALANKDYDGVAAAAQKIGSSDSMAQMCTHMGAGQSGFTPTALDFHRTADTITAAARKKDATAVLAAVDATLGKCVACHATYKQEVVDEATWTKLTSMAPPMGHEK